MSALTRYVVVSAMPDGQLYEHTRCETLIVARQEARELTNPSPDEAGRFGFPDEAVVLIYRVTQELVETVTAAFAAEVQP